MKKITFIFALLAIVFNSQAQIPAGYYTNATGTGDVLRDQLRAIITNGHTSNSYDNLEDDFYYTDNLGSQKVWDMYAMDGNGNAAYYFYYNVSGDQCGSYSGEGDCWNKEHSFPKSWWGGGSSIQYADLFHLVPTDGYVNNQRSNYPFGEVASPTWTSTNGSKKGACSFPGYTGTVFEPVDAYKGDFARNYFYMATRYMNSFASWETNVTHVIDGNNFTAWTINLLIKWHELDPVSTKEIDRNNAAHDIQGNRNPYIDHPEYVCSVWGGACGTANPQSFSATGVSVSQINLAWTLNPDNDKVVVAYNTTSTFGTPVDGTTYTAGNSISGGGTVLYVGTSTAFNHTALSSQIYYYKIWSQATDNSFSTGLTAQASPLVGEPESNVTNFTVTAETSTTISLSWTGSAGGQLPSYYLIKASTGTVADPADGTPVADGTLAKNVAYGTNVVTFSGLTPSTLYNFKIYPYTNSGTNIDYLISETPSTSGTTTVATVPSIFISEFAMKGYNADYNDEYIELINLGSSSTSLSGWTLEYYEATLETTLNLTGTINANSTYIISVRTTHTTAITPDFSANFSLGSGDCYAILKQGTTIMDQAGSTVDKFSADSNWEFTNCTADNLPVANWVNLGAANGTPGVVNCDGIGVNSLLGNQISVYPNPTQNTITVSNININDKISIINYLGQNILNLNAKSENQIIDLSKQSEGIYFVLIYEDNKLIKTQKIIKRK
jgi:endonuclease I